MSFDTSTYTQQYAFDMDWSNYRPLSARQTLHRSQQSLHVQHKLDTKRRFQARGQAKTALLAPAVPVLGAVATKGTRPCGRWRHTCPCGRSSKQRERVATLVIGGAIERQTSFRKRNRTVMGCGLVVRMDKLRLRLVKVWSDCRKLV